MTLKINGKLHIIIIYHNNCYNYIDGEIKIEIKIKLKII